MTWFSDIEEWSILNTRDPEIVENICIRKGWDPTKYSSSMKSALFDWLDQWYTLSIKKLSTPATSLRRNPDKKMHVICAYCNAHISGDPSFPESHGCCPKCYLIQLEEIEKAKKEYLKKKNNRSVNRNPLQKFVFCPKCGRRIVYLKRTASGMMLGSCGDRFHDLQCQCQFCD